MATENRTQSESQIRSSEMVRCWCRACRQDKNENEMFAGIIHPDGIGRGICIQCHQTGKDVERWNRLDEQTAPNEKSSHAASTT